MLRSTELADVRSIVSAIAGVSGLRKSQGLALLVPVEGQGVEFAQLRSCQRPRLTAFKNGRCDIRSELSALHNRASTLRHRKMIDIGSFCHS